MHCLCSIPQSVCSRHALKIGAVSVPIVLFFLILCFPIAYPISLILDAVLGLEIAAVYTKHELLELVRLNVDDPAHAAESGIPKELGGIMKGALMYRDTEVAKVMTPLIDTFKLPLSAVLDKKTFLEILELGHTRIPVYEKREDNIVAVLYAKDLVGLGYEKCTPLRNVVASFASTERVHAVRASSNLGVAFDVCKEKRLHMLIAVDEGGTKAVGVITTEDVLEEILQYEIVGDDDKYLDNSSKTAASLPTASERLGKARTLQKNNSKRYDPTSLIRGSAELDTREVKVGLP